MKFFHATLCSALATLILSSTAYAKDYVVVLSPMQSQNIVLEHIKQAINFSLNDTDLGDRVLFIDGMHNQTIATFEVPNKETYKIIKAKARHNALAFAKLKAFANQPKAIPEHVVDGAIALPQTLEFIGQHYRDYAGADIIILASPIYTHYRDDAFSMKGGKFPNDGYMNASADISVYSLQNRADLLKGTKIYWYTLNKSWMISEFYSNHVKRFWTLYIEGHGAVLANFEDDFPALWKNIRIGTEALPHGYALDATQKLEVIEENPAPQKKSQSQSQRQSIYERKLATTPPKPATFRQAKNVEIGISWDCQECDLDLHVKAHRNAETLYYGNRETDEGFYHKDYVQSPFTQNGYETVTMRVPMDLHDPIIAINWYGGQAPQGITGEIRIAIDGVTYGKAFYFKGGSGSVGAGREVTLASGKAANKNWLMIDPLEIVGL